MPAILTGQALRAFAHALPKVELHVHLVGSASLPTVLELARRRPAAGVPTDERELAEFFTFRDFAHFLTVYLAVTSLVRDRHDIHTLVTGLAADLAAHHCRYAEVTVTPYNHLLDGMSGDDLLAGLETGRARAAELGVELAWCFDIPGEKGVRAGRETLVFALRERPAGLVSFGLGGPELGVGRAQFEPFFTRAREAGLHSVPHAGETTGPATIWSALHDLGAERIGHGTSCAADPALLEHLAAHRIPLEVCPTSNVRTGQVADIAAHPVRRMLDHGLVVTLNTDDPPMFGATLTGEYVAVAETLGLTTAELVRLAENAVAASFLDEQRKAVLRTEITEMTLPRATDFA
ncbi:adenosine deaminase [Amycolatopsis mediterranei S699]|uniref:Adenosine deaminase n=4 Tax=Amycolatopsis mediterranei TaxID=33910 RepID=A0A0H3DEE8_AMYMU|nr:adenosine deaminase [Amycolatopsis mediterranei]ADJ48009.1 adenosine deaminase [Amycolatopsis mediterranei U32]AEK44910.1 adenosine deaminase [Amycolatopsis mediterranei S699]AFO79720.1 adenosine deaminase [Amycolatopsis mediterranei S699]KDO10495.1 adenosine deaminase [Amycolatopsis mediterranei]KDU86957.1 adenosine deaminase [Amycolatopsis mediterranei]